jgi:hypothetical protein
VSLNQGRVAFQLFIGQFLEEVFSETQLPLISILENRRRRKRAGVSNSPGPLSVE